MNLRTADGFLGTNAPLMADLTLVAYLLIIVPVILVGFFFARRKWFEPHHKLTMTGITIGNWIFIIFVMLVSYMDSVRPSLPEDLNQDYVYIPTIHLLTGLAAQLLATYLVMRMWLENVLPDWMKIKNIKLFMRLTLVLWLVTAALGVTLYIVWYSPETTNAQDIPGPVTTEEPSPDSDGLAIEPITTEEASNDTDTTPEPVTTEEVASPITTPEVSNTCQAQLDIELAECRQEAQEERTDCEREDDADADDRAECLQEIENKQAECEADAQADADECN